MKTSINTFAILFTITAGAFTANAEKNDNKKSDELETGIYSSKSGKINVLVDKASDHAATTILLKNADGDIVYNEVIHRNEQHFGRILDVNALKDGNYEISVSSKGQTETKSFHLSERKTERVVAIK